MAASRRPHATVALCSRRDVRPDGEPAPSPSRRGCCPLGCRAGWSPTAPLEQRLHPASPTAARCGGTQTARRQLELPFYGYLRPRARGARNKYTRAPSGSQLFSSSSSSAAPSPRNRCTALAASLPPCHLPPVLLLPDCLTCRRPPLSACAARQS